MARQYRWPLRTPSGISMSNGPRFVKAQWWNLACWPCKPLCIVEYLKHRYLKEPNPIYTKENAQEHHQHHHLVQNTISTIIQHIQPWFSSIFPYLFTLITDLLLIRSANNVVNQYIFIIIILLFSCFSPLFPCY